MTSVEGLLFHRAVHKTVQLEKRESGGVVHIDVRMVFGKYAAPAQAVDFLAHDAEADRVAFFRVDFQQFFADAVEVAQYVSHRQLGAVVFRLIHSFLLQAVAHCWSSKGLIEDSINTARYKSVNVGLKQVMCFLNLHIFYIKVLVLTIYMLVTIL